MNPICCQSTLSFTFYRENALILGSLRLRQYPLYSKTEPPAALAGHFKPEVFAKSQAYGRDKARFSLVSGIFKQCLDSALLHYGLYAWTWSLAGTTIAKLGYTPEYEVRTNVLTHVMN